MKMVSREQALTAMGILGTNADWEKVSGDVLQTAIDDPKRFGDEFTAFLKNGGRAVIVVVGNLTIDLDAAPLIPDGLSLAPEADQLPNRARGIFTLDPSKVELHLDPGQKDGKTIRGTELKDRLAVLPSGKILPAHVLDFYRAHPELIPDSWKGQVVFFWGTLYRDAVGSLYVRYLDWNGASWYWDYYRLGSAWDGGFPALLAS